MDLFSILLQARAHLARPHPRWQVSPRRRILGVLPLVIATGAGAASRRILGTTVLGGMVAATFIAIFIIPTTFYVRQRFNRRAAAPAAPPSQLHWWTGHRGARRRRNASMSSVIRRVVIVALTLAAGRAGCAIDPDYKWPALTPPKQFRGQSAAETSSLADLPWWEVFGDPVLRALIQEALAGNYDLRIAAERVQQARAQSMIAGAAFFPASGYQATAQRSKQFETFLGISSYRVDFSGSNLFVGALQATWEIDVCGARIRRSTSAASLGEPRAACAGPRC